MLLHNIYLLLTLLVLVFFKVHPKVDPVCRFRLDDPLDEDFLAIAPVGILQVISWSYFEDVNGVYIQYMYIYIYV